MFRNTTNWLLVLFSAFLCLAAAPLQTARAARPNVVLVMTDDQGYGDVAFHGNKMIQTPNLDALAKQSVRLSNFHVDPTCAETRSALMTGRYSSRVGVWHTIMGRSLLREDETTMADVFSDNGYRTGIFGKWHLGDNYPFRPQDRGFQNVFIHGGGGVGQTPDYWGNDYFDDTYFRQGKPEPQKGYCTDRWFSEALDFIKQKKDQPFFCYITTNAPHGPYLVDEEYSRPYGKQGVPATMAKFYGMITNIDENVGRLVAKLDEWKLAENTILIFMTDNGTAAGVVRRRGQAPRSGWQGFNADMRGQKGSQYEGGHRVPCYVRWPGKVGKPRSEDVLAAHLDLLPTLIDLCEMKSPKDVEFDGTSLARLIRGGEEGKLRDRTLFVHSQRVDHPVKWKSSSVMTDRWRLVNGSELYDMRQDAGQKKNLASDQSAVVEKLRSQYEKWWTSISSRFDEYCEIQLGASEQNPTTLTCHDWHTDLRRVPWNQGHIRSNLVGNGTWAVKVVRDGKYRFTLRQRPAGVDYQLKPGKARLKIGKTEATAKVADGQDCVELTVDLKAGSAMLQTWLDEDEGASRGAYYVTVRKLD